MLVLRRKVGEEIRIGEDVVIKVLAVNGRSLRLGIEAPTAMPIWRAECMAGGVKTLKQPESVTTS